MSDLADSVRTEGSRSTLARALSIFDLFETGKMDWTLEEITAALGIASSTAYRYIKTLIEADFIAISSDGKYTIGPRVSLLEYFMRKSDPLVRLSEPFAQQLIGQYCGAVLVNRAFRDGLITIHRRQSPDDQRDMHGRGVKMDPVRGAHAKLSQAYMSRHRLQKLYQENADGFGDIGVDSFEALSKSLRRVRKERVFVNDGGFRADSMAVVAPFLDKSKVLTGSFSFTARRGSITPLQMPGLIRLVDEAARSISLNL